MATTELRTAPLHMIRHQDGAIIDLKPLQGFWTTEQYLRLSDHTRMLMEFTDGVIEVLALPTDRHQTILEFLFLLFHSYIQPKGGKILFAALRLAIRPNTFREPDLILLCDANDPRRQNRFWLGADLVVEAVSEDDPERDTVDKVADYAEAKIPEYWIINLIRWMKLSPYYGLLTLHTSPMVSTAAVKWRFRHSSQIVGCR